VRERLLRGEGGFTLAEVLVTMMIMTTVMFALYSIFDMSLRVFSFGNNETEAVENARLGLEKLDREITAAFPYDKAASTPNTALFATWTANQVTFGNDLNGNRKIECPVTGMPACEVISYSVYQPAGGSTYALGRANSPAGTLQPVVEFVDYAGPSNTGLRFRYFQRDGVTEVLPGGDESRIAMVSIELRIKVERGVQPGAQTLATDVALRNRVN
jgi:prepilin-type N-terminal cleavage/methylation domain-containing protein